MPFTADQLPVLTIWSLALGSTAVLLALMALVGATQSWIQTRGSLLYFMGCNAIWASGIAVVLLPMAPLPRALVMHWIWVGSALTAGFWVRAVLTHVDRDHWLLRRMSWGALAMAVLIGLDGLLVLGGGGWLTSLAPVPNPGLLARAAGNQVSFEPMAAVVGATWGLGVLVASVLLFRLVRKEAPGERLVQLGVAITGVVSVVDGVTATLPDAVALSFAANLVEALVLTAAQVRRVAVRLSEVEQASEAQSAHMQLQLDRLRKLQRLSVLGAEAARIGHDLRNPLTVILAGVEHLQELLVQAGHSAEEVEEVAKATTVAMEQTLALASGMTRSVRRADRPEPFDVDACVRDALLLCAPHLCQVEVTVNPVNASLVGQSAELVQVLVNLIQNAADAIKDQEQPWIRVEGSSSVDEVKLRVVDSGQRPPDDVVRRMFQTQFTTKGPSGTGLGLEICQHLVKGMGGRIGVDLSTSTTCVQIRIARQRRRGPQSQHIMRS